MKTVLILGANSDVAKQCLLQYSKKGYFIMAASRNVEALKELSSQHQLTSAKIKILYFDAIDFDSHQKFYQNLPSKPNIVLYAAGFLVEQAIAFHDFEKSFQMMKTNYAGAVSILNIVATDLQNPHLERIIGLSSLSGVRGRKSNYIYGSTKAAFTTYLEGLRQELSVKNVVVNALVIGYINTKINQGLQLNKNLIMKPDYVAHKIVNAGKSFIIIPNYKWKLIYWIVKLLPEHLLSKLP